MKEVDGVEKIVLRLTKLEIEVILAALAHYGISSSTLAPYQPDANLAQTASKHQN